MLFKIHQDIFERFPGLNIGLVIAKDIDNSGESSEALAFLRERSRLVKDDLDTETLAEHPKIRSWREAYRSFGAKKYRASVENLCRIVLDGIELRHINTVVDLYNAVSLKHLIPIGGDDLDKIDGSITLKLASGDEPFVQLNSEETAHPKQGEVVYADAGEILCRRWNWRECDKSKMTGETKNAVLVAEGLPPFSRDEIIGVAEELGELIRKHCGGHISTHVLHMESAEIKVALDAKSCFPV